MDLANYIRNSTTEQVMSQSQKKNGANWYVSRNDVGGVSKNMGVMLYRFVQNSIADGAHKRTHQTFPSFLVK